MLTEEQIFRLYSANAHSGPFTASMSIVALLALLLTLAAFLFWLWMFVDCLRKVHPHPNDKLTWVLVLIFTNFLDALIYFFVERPRTQNENAGMTPIRDRLP